MNPERELRDAGGEHDGALEIVNRAGRSGSYPNPRTGGRATREAEFGLVEHSDVVGTLVLDEAADLPARTVDDLGHLVG